MRRSVNRAIGEHDLLPILTICYYSPSRFFACTQAASVMSRASQLAAGTGLRSTLHLSSLDGLLGNMKRNVHSGTMPYTGN